MAGQATREMDDRLRNATTPQLIETFRRPEVNGGRSLIKMVEDELDMAVKEWQTAVENHGVASDEMWFCEGIAHALSVFKSTGDADHELDLARGRIKAREEDDGNKGRDTGQDDLTS